MSEGGAQPADVWDAFGNHVVADRAEGSCLTQGVQLLILDRDLQVRADV